MVENVIPLSTKLIAGGCVFALQTLGVDAAPVFWAMVGASIGMSFAKPASLGRAAVVFVAVVFACSLWGTWLVQTYLTDNPINRNAAACGMAMTFHLVWNVAAERAPKLVDAAMDVLVAIFRAWWPGRKP